MLSRVSSAVARQSALRAAARRTAAIDTKRTFVQPSGADRASVVDVPATYQEDAYFTPRSGKYIHSLHSLEITFQNRHARLQARVSQERGLCRRKSPPYLPRHAGILCPRTISYPPFSRNCSLGNNSGRPQGLGCYATVFDRSVWKSSQSDARLRLGGRECRRECSQGQCGSSQSFIPCVSYSSRKLQLSLAQTQRISYSPLAQQNPTTWLSKA